MAKAKRAATSTSTRLALLEEGLSDVKKLVVNLRDNHLAHLQIDVTDLKVKFSERPTWLVSSIIALLSSVTVGLLVKLACM